ncbi:Regulator of phospholipase D SRF1 [Nakaseomyces glabratus]|nr:Regulator of phospholipase D SRF1 [Nakaseomyces glabratus]KTB19639.1 Regulator of phospholipase D SRF1 [Nakaseomyces glabratus]
MERMVKDVVGHPQDPDERSDNSVSDQPRVDGGKQSNKGNVGHGNGVSDHKRQMVSLNPYGLYPSTVPPFVLESDFRRLHGINDDFNDREVRWANFIGNVGSNVAYSTEQRLPSRGIANNATLRHNYSVGNIKDQPNRHIEDIIDPLVSTGNNSINESASLDHEEMERKRKIQEEILYDLDSEWKGGERLDAVFNFSVNKDFEFKNEKDRIDWVNYISKVKNAYYAPNKESSGINDESSSSLSQQQEGNRGDRQNYDWMEELNKEKEKWKKLKQRKIQKWKPALSNLLFYNQYLPLGFRIVIGILCLISLGLSVRIYQNSDSSIEQVEGGGADLDTGIPQQASTIMAICVNTIAIAYTFYIAIDEFSGKPLGLRNPLGKLKLILSDLLFIIFASANLALAFNTRFDKEWVCTGLGVTIAEEEVYYPKIPYICRKQKALASFLFVLLFAWVVTFSVSIARVVDKVHSSATRD